MDLKIELNKLNQQSEPQIQDISTRWNDNIENVQAVYKKCSSLLLFILVYP